MEHEKSGVIDKSEAFTRRESLGNNLINDLKTVLSTCKFNETAHCLEHDTQCYISPRHDPQFDRCL